MGDATQAVLQADLALAERVIASHVDIAATAAHAEETAFTFARVAGAPVAADLPAVLSAIQIAADEERMAGLATHVAKIARRVRRGVSEHFTDMGAVAVALAHGISEVLLLRDFAAGRQLAGAIWVTWR